MDEYGSDSVSTKRPSPILRQDPPEIPSCTCGEESGMVEGETDLAVWFVQADGSGRRTARKTFTSVPTAAPPCPLTDLTMVRV